VTFKAQGFKSRANTCNWGFLSRGMDNFFESVMLTLWLTLALVVIATVVLMELGVWADLLPSTYLHKSPRVDRLIKFHGAQMVLGSVVLVVLYVLSPTGFALLVRVGDLEAPAGKSLSWLDITSNTPWSQAAFIISVPMVLFAGACLWCEVGRIVRPARLPTMLPWAALFALANSFCEEIIFRVAFLAPLCQIFPAGQLAVMSAILFSLPHYYGLPSGVAGVVLATFCGLFFALSVLETSGVLVALMLHFMEDLVIFVLHLSTDEIAGCGEYTILLYPPADEAQLQN